MATDSIIRTLAAAPDTDATMPALFIGHGNPMNASPMLNWIRSGGWTMAHGRCYAGCTPKLMCRWFN